MSESERKGDTAYISATHTLDSGTDLVQTYADTIKIKLLCNWCDDLATKWGRMAQRVEGRVAYWDNLMFYSSKNGDFVPDYYVVINATNEEIIPSKTIVFRMEPDTEDLGSGYNPRWDQWYRDYKKEDFMYFLDLSKYRNNIEWWLGKTRQGLTKEEIKKTKGNIASSVVSGLYKSEGHKFRIDLLKEMERVKTLERSSLLIDLHIYGNSNPHNFKSYISSLPDHNKNDGILPYKYTIIAENSSINNYITEKLYDAILGETLCFYWGADNVDSLVDPRTYIKLYKENDEKTRTKNIELIKKSINDNEWEKRLEYIKIEKRRILNNLSFFPRVQSLLMYKEMKKYVIQSENSDKIEDFIQKCKAHNITDVTPVSNVYELKDKTDFILFGDTTSSFCPDFVDKVCEELVDSFTRGNVRIGKNSFLVHTPTTKIVKELMLYGK